MLLLDSLVNNSLVANSKHFYFDYNNGKYGYNTNPNRGADTFVPFSSLEKLFNPDYRYDTTIDWSTRKTFTLDFIPSFIFIKDDNGSNGQGIEFYDIKNNINLHFWHLEPFRITEGKPSIIESINDNIVTVYGYGSLNIRSVWFYK